ncbi:MAG: hypothetical protein WBL28_08580 [Methylotenera sp.]
MNKLLTCLLCVFICASSTYAHEATPIKDADGNVLPKDIRMLFKRGVMTQELPADRETVPYPNLTLNSLAESEWTNHRNDGDDVYIADGDDADVSRTKISDKMEQSYFVGNVSKGSRNIAVVSKVIYPVNGEGTIKEVLTDVLLRKTPHEWLVQCGEKSEGSAKVNSNYTVPAGYTLFAIVNDTNAAKKMIRKSENAPENVACHTYETPATRTYLLSNNNGKLKKFKIKGLSCAHLLSDCDAP